MDSNKTTLAAAILVAYLAGRTKQGKLLLGALAAVSGRGMDPAALIGQGFSKLEQNPLVAELSEKIRGELLNAGRAAVSAATSRGVSSLTDTLQRRTGSLLDGGEEDGNDTSEEHATEEVEDEADEDQEEDLDEEPNEDGEPADEEEAPEPESPSRHRAAHRAEKPTDRKAGPKNPPAKRAMARKAAQRKPGPKNPPAKKAMARAADSEAAERKAAGRRSRQR